MMIPLEARKGLLWATAAILAAAFCILLIHLNRDPFSSVIQSSEIFTPNVVCRLVVMEVMYESEMQDTDEIICVPLVNGRESSLEAQLSLPQFILDNAEYSQKLQQGQLYANITNATIVHGELRLSHDSTFDVIDYSPSHPRRLGENSATTGTLTIAIIRISTIDSEPSVSREQLLSLFDDSEETVSFPSQFKKCSAGRLTWEPVDVFDVSVNQPISDFSSGASIVHAAIRQVQLDLNIEDITFIADRIMFCTPPGTGSWVASAGLYHWRAQFNDDWCLSITAAMHELSHTIGFLHSNKDGVKYADTTGNMAKSFRTSDAPLRCFNGRNNHLLGWYYDREVMIDPLKTFPELIKLAAFVDYTKSAEDEPVLVTLPGNLHIQFNRAKSYNSGTGLYQDMVTITGEGLAGTELIAGLGVGDQLIVESFQNTVADLSIEVCEWIKNDNGVDIMMISVGIGPSKCESGITSRNTINYHFPPDEQSQNISGHQVSVDCAVKGLCKLSNRLKVWGSNVGSNLP
jgi:hypothetical protein